MTEIAEAVLTLRTDDTALDRGLADAERKTLDALHRIETVAARANLTVDGASLTALTTAITVTDGLALGLAGLTRTGATAATSIAALTAALPALAGAGANAAAQIAAAASTAANAAARLVAQAAAIRASAVTGETSPAGTGSPQSHPFDIARLARATPRFTHTFAAPAPAAAAPADRPPTATSPRTTTTAANAPLVGALHVTVERENPRAIQLGVERALQDLAARADLAGAID